jgi:hypothetical protein
MKELILSDQWAAPETVNRKSAPLKAGETEGRHDLRGKVESASPGKEDDAP